jgi:hypothetical protein
MRLQHIWWPSADFDIQDQSFIYHETTAAWFTVLAGLKCRMVNRFGLSWWLRDQTYPILLAERLATCLGLQTTTANWTTTPHEPTWHSEHEPSNDVRVVYVIGKYIIPRRYSDRLLARDLIVKMDALARWQGETGATLSRITFQRGDHLRVKEVDIFPRLEQEEPDLLARVSAAVVSQWA